MSDIRIDVRQADRRDDAPGREVSPRPYQVRGRIVDADGKPLAAEVIALDANVGSETVLGQMRASDEGRLVIQYQPEELGRAGKVKADLVLRVNQPGSKEAPATTPWCGFARRRASASASPAAAPWELRTNGSTNLAAFAPECICDMVLLHTYQVDPP